MPDLHGEQLRLAALRAYEVLDSAPAPDFDGIVSLAALVTGAPLAIINLLDADRLWHAAVHGGPGGQIPRQQTMCEHVATSRTPLHMADASQDVRWCGVPQVDGRASQVRMYAAAPLVDRNGFALGTLCVLSEQPGELSPSQLGALEILANQVVELLESRKRALQLAAAVDELDRLAHVDPLTGLVNRTAASRALQRLCRAGGWGVLFIDVDDFKSVNDRYGHDAGDHVLREIAARLKEGLRPDDLLARWAGDEFLALIAGPVDATAVARVRARLQAQVARPFSHAGAELPLSVSIGGLAVEPGSDPCDVVRAADRAMFADKGGRDRRGGGRRATDALAGATEA